MSVKAPFPQGMPGAKKGKTYFDKLKEFRIELRLLPEELNVDYYRYTLSRF